jgi:hypothetical protein
MCSGSERSGKRPVSPNYQQHLRVLPAASGAVLDLARCECLPVTALYLFSEGSAYGGVGRFAGSARRSTRFYVCNSEGHRLREAILRGCTAPLTGMYADHRRLHTHCARSQWLRRNLNARSYNTHKTSRHRLIRCYTKEMTAQSVLLNSESAPTEGTDKEGNSGSANQRFESSLPSHSPQIPYGVRTSSFFEFSTPCGKGG